VNAVADNNYAKEAAMKILHLDDDRFILDLARQWLEGAGHAVTGCESGERAVQAIQKDSFDLAILDRSVPDVPGEEVLRWIRTHHPRLPVIFATSTDSEDEIARVLNLGADDYIVKPLRRAEFLARVTAVARRAGINGNDTIDEPPYRVNARERSISVSGTPVRLTPRLFDLAFLLFSRRGELVTRPQIFLQVWGHPETAESRTVDTHVSRLRHLLELDGRHGWRLVSVYQHGYRLEQAG
jgi:DNA-binding response OmpR family regulator